MRWGVSGSLPHLFYQGWWSVCIRIDQFTVAQPCR